MTSSDSPSEQTVNSLESRETLICDADGCDRPAEILTRRKIEDTIIGDNYWCEEHHPFKHRIEIILIKEPK